MKALVGAPSSFKTSLAFQYCYDLLVKIQDRPDAAKLYVYYIGHLSKCGSASFVFGKLQRMNQHTVSRLLLKFLRNYHDLAELLAQLNEFPLPPLILVLDDLHLFLDSLPKSCQRTARLKLYGLLHHLSNHVVLDILKPRMPNLLLMTCATSLKAAKREMLIMGNMGFQASYLTKSIIDINQQESKDAGLLSSYSLKHAHQDREGPITNKLEFVPNKEHQSIQRILDLYSKILRNQ